MLKGLSTPNQNQLMFSIRSIQTQSCICFPYLPKFNSEDLIPTTKGKLELLKQASASFDAEYKGCRENRFAWNFERQSKYNGVLQGLYQPLGQKPET